ncbi:hypothetical protein HHK36_013770 [Tetracentron sinense]|uniref:Heptahelical transmembrane protein 2 n=1 Tax=Tetracentron sinense TaxID=13715 RepID=A0A835DH23_TETSI|nr:hypothetical protein HHK36_013770 [Tetracentron sinense]
MTEMDLKGVRRRKSFPNGSNKKAKGYRSGSEKEDRSTKKEKFECRLVKYDDLPEYLKDNEYILDYYRSEWPLKEAFLSVFSWHNETLNIWTHLGGFFIFVALTVLSSIEAPEVRGLLSCLSRPLPTPLMMMKKNISDNLFPDFLARHVSRPSSLHVDGGGLEAIPRWPWFVFLVGAMGCLICSSLSHLLACHSQRLNFFFWRLDYAGISLMIVSSFFPPIYYAFFCNPHARLFYLTTITLLGILAIITLLAPALSTPRFRPFRATLFLAMGFSGVVPAAHSVALHWNHPQTFVALAFELTMAVFYATGAAFYVSRVPEKWKPGAFDIVGHSHQIFHVFVVAGALAHYAATLVLLNWREGSLTCETGGSAN